jgi:uncharacterized protein YdhG (YjbR/CyaY superfamily)
MTKKAHMPQTPDEYLLALSEPARTTLHQVRAMIRAAAPATATERISYGMPMFHHQGMVMGYAAFKDHCSVFPGAIVADFAEELKGYRTAKGTVQFALNKPLPAALIRKLVKAAVASLPGYLTTLQSGTSGAAPRGCRLGNRAETFPATHCLSKRQASRRSSMPQITA